MNLFKGKIKCMKCHRNYNFKDDNGSYIYLCSTYKNRGSSACPRNAIHEKDLIHIVNLHCHMAVKNIDLIELIDRIEVDGEMVTIYYSDETVTIWDRNKLEI